MLLQALYWITSTIGRRDEALRNAWAVVGWWEMRRVRFNLIVGATGLVTTSVMVAVSVISDRLIGVPVGVPDPPLLAVLGIVGFAVAANLCYTGGWVAELIVRRAWPDFAQRFGTITFALGLGFSILVTLLPSVLVIVAAVLFGVAQWIGS